MTFDELCRKNLGAADYIALAQTFHTVALRGVPIFKSDLKSEAYRFVTLVDVLYENRIQVMCSAAGNPVELFQNVFSQEEAKQPVRFCTFKYLRQHSDNCDLGSHFKSKTFATSFSNWQTHTFLTVKGVLKLLG